MSSYCEGIFLVQITVFSVYWIAAAVILLYGHFKSTVINNIQWMCFSVISLYLIVFFLVALLHHKFIKDERNTGWCHDDDVVKHTNHSTTAIVNETLNEIQLQPAAAMTTSSSSSAMMMAINNNKSVSVMECEEKFYQKVGQQESS